MPAKLEHAAPESLERPWSKISPQLTRQSEGVGEVQDVRADEALESLGYVPELVQTRSTFHVAFMSFVLASVPYGLATSLFYPLINGGPSTIIWGWALLSAIILCVAAS